MSAPNRKSTVRLTDRADRDVHDILLYTRRTWGKRQRTNYRAAIEGAIRRLEDHPQLGQPQDDLFVGCRALPVEELLIYYHQPRSEEIVTHPPPTAGCHGQGPAMNASAQIA